MKKSFFKILCAIMTMIPVCLISACSDGGHVHNYEETVTEATCTQQGYTTYTCECGDSYIADYVIQSHDYKDGKCIYCGQTKISSIKLKGTLPITNVGDYFAKGTVKEAEFEWNEDGSLQIKIAGTKTYGGSSYYVAVTVLFLDNHNNQVYLLSMPGKPVGDGADFAIDYKLSAGILDPTEDYIIEIR